MSVANQPVIPVYKADSAIGLFWVRLRHEISDPMANGEAVQFHLLGLVSGEIALP
jgi:hypothetical protein